MRTGRGLALLRVIACMLCLAAPSLQSAAAPATAGPAFAWAQPVAQDKEETCGRGKATKEFGWKVVEFGVSTLRYLIGLFIIPIGFFLVVIGAMLQMVEAVAC